MFTRLMFPVALVMVAGASQAQDWTGFYAGGQIGSLSADTTATGRENDLSYGVHVGYMSELAGGLVLGGELQYDWTDIDLGAATVDEVGRLKGIVGYDAGVVLPYAVVGAAQVDTSIGSADGWLAGAGLGYQISPTLALSGEILYHEFDNIGSTSIDADATSANLRLSFRF